MKRLALTLAFALAAGAAGAAQPQPYAAFTIPANPSQPNSGSTTIDTNGGVTYYMPVNPGNPLDRSGILLTPNGQTCNVMGDGMGGAITVCH